MISAMSYFMQALVYLTDLIFGLYLLAVLLRFLLQMVRADFYNPICQFLVTITDPALRPLRYCLPVYSSVYLPQICLMVLLQTVEICLITLLLSGQLPTMVSLPAIIASRLLKLLIYTYTFIIFIRALISLLHPQNYSPLTVLLYQLSEPLMRPVRRHIPATTGIDWSPLLILALLQLALILFVAPLHDWGNYLLRRP